MINPPNRPTNDPNRNLDLKLAMEEEFQSMADLDEKALENEFRSVQNRALAAGWTLNEIACAMWSLSLGGNYRAHTRH
jgi:hypothetical protein